MQSDAHLHLVDLAGHDPGFPERLAATPWLGCAASHDEAEFGRSETLRARIESGGGARCVASFGIHPQWAVWKNADFLARLAAERRIAVIGEAGFDFFGDRPERVRNEENERAQRAVFEYQLGLAERHGLPLLLHLRKAMDLAYAYAGRLRRLSGAVFHSYSGGERDIESLLAKGVPAWFSFGTPILKGNKRARAACAAAPEARLLAETDAPWQPTRGSLFCRAEDISAVIAEMAAIRGVEAHRLEERLEANFRDCYRIS
ncbi:MAG TPA: TatD family hydrolase [Rectinemataceae bacterium]|nr:TatD family hydrolase [Rectinemataceae bacterium]